MEKPTSQGDIVITYPGYEPLLIKGSVEISPVAEPDAGDSSED